MKSTQNEKISQIKFETLVVGIDIGKETHYSSIFATAYWLLPTVKTWPCPVSASVI
jgi:hypothetical protein